ncbi:MAG TPA: TonB family protein [Gemmatimonadales bacterium]|jgi:TonB family protein|nr:TonB family protein [Gemmatimonadales bacterium]
MIRLFAPPTPDAVIRRNAMTAGSFVLHVVVLGLLFIPVSRAVKAGLFEQLAVYLVPPDNAASEEHAPGNAPLASLAAEARPDPGGAAPTTDAPTGVTAARSRVPLLSLTKLDPAPLLRPEDHAYTELQVDSAAARDPSSAAPEYPRWMLQKGIEGAAAVIYVVDSTGLVDTTSFRVMSTTHPDFALAVQLALPAMRFRPAFQQGHPVRQLVQQTFRFRITRTDSIRAPNDLPPAA